MEARGRDEGQEIASGLLGLNELEPMLVHAQELMNTFRLVANNSTFGYHVTIPTDLGTSMHDLAGRGATLS